MQVQRKASRRQKIAQRKRQRKSEKQAAQGEEYPQNKVRKQNQLLRVFGAWWRCVMECSCARLLKDNTWFFNCEQCVECLVAWEAELVVASSWFSGHYGAFKQKWALNVSGGILNLPRIVSGCTWFLLQCK